MKRIKHFSMSIALLLVLVITLGIGSAYAWFTDTKSGSGSVQFGKIEIDVTSNGSALTNKTFDKTNLLPGDSILDYDVIANKTADSQPFYFRVELSFSVDDSISEYADTLNSLLTAENIGDGTNFVKDESVTDRAVFYYGTSTALTKVDHTNDIVILDKDKFTVPSTLTQLPDSAQFNKTVSLSVTVVALQSANMTATMTEFKDAYLQDLRQLIKITEEDGKQYMYFGSYPQTLKVDDVTIDESNVDANGYYLGSDGERYAKQIICSYAGQLSSNCTAVDWQETLKQTTTASGTKMIVAEYYYFKVEPIKWRILSTSNGEYTLVCDSILSNSAYQPNLSGNYATDGNGNILTDGKGNNIYANNYEYSDLRRWLNNAFYNNAFTASERTLILTTTVDNSANQYPSDLGVDADNKFLCKNTLDKVYALSMADVTNTAYGFNANYTVQDATRYWATTDYAKATGALTVTAGFITYWFDVSEGSNEWNAYSPYIGSGGVRLRTPEEDFTLGSYAAGLGVVSDDFGSVDRAYGGAVPAIRVSI